ncbi:hypothetical protein [Streptomyces beigongshangae]|uniref:hypothetical protein n=1 Tax=Streptomyces beigongshangae TaxID=2841597 RepID=UPI001C8602DB|nr:hypothetical protein [Streptomyces sp. REN17]
MTPPGLSGRRAAHSRCHFEAAPAVTRNDSPVRAAIDRLLAGQIPPGGACDVKTLAREAGISRASLHRTWGHLKDEFEKRRAAVWPAGQQPDPREARIARLRDLSQRLRRELSTFDNTPVSVSEVDQGDDAAGVVTLPRR